MADGDAKRIGGPDLIQNKETGKVTQDPGTSINRDGDGKTGKKNRGKKKLNPSPNMNDDKPNETETLEKIKNILESSDYLELIIERVEHVSSLENKAAKVLVTVKTTGGGTIKILTNAGLLAFLGGTGKLAGFVGDAGAIVGMYSDFRQYQEGEISGQRASYRISGAALSIFTPLIYTIAVGTAAEPGGYISG